MKKIKKILASPGVTIAAFVLAAGLLLFSSIGGARAALTFYSEDYVSGIEMLEIGVALLENGNVRSGDDELLTGMLPEGEKLIFNKRYQEALNVRNTGRISQYARVSVYKYWMEDKDGQYVKTQELSPDLIQLFLNGQVLNPRGDAETMSTLAENGWILDWKASTEERMVLYYSRPITAADAETETPAGESSLFVDQIAIDGSIAQKVVKTYDEENNTFRITYTYNGYKFCLDVKVDAVQDHNAQDAILSAWGRPVVIDENGILSLPDNALPADNSSSDLTN